MACFSDRLVELRKLKGETQISMATFLGCTEQHYQRLEYGKVKLNHIYLVKLADFFDVSADYLLGRSDNSQRQ